MGQQQLKRAHIVKHTPVKIYMWYIIGLYLNILALRDNKKMLYFMGKGE